MTSYISEHSQYIAYNSYFSNSHIVSSRVPQGSNLEPLLFLLYILDFRDVFCCNPVSFTDDLIMYTVVELI